MADKICYERINAVSHTIHQSTGRSPLWVYEQNYRMLMQIMHQQLDNGFESVLFYENDAMVIKASLLETCKYSQVLELEENSAVVSKLLGGLKLKVRVYHDAQVAEVIDYQGHYRIKAKYDYPNQNMYYPDEKRQVNHLLSEWLHSFNSSSLEQDRDSVYSE